MKLNEEKLKSQFEKDISDKFHFFYFAKDDERTSEGIENKKIKLGVGQSIRISKSILFK